MFELLAAAAPAGGAQEPWWSSLLLMGGMIAIFWFLLIRPQMRQQKEHRQKVEAIKKGDKVITQGGLLGKVIKVDDTYAEVELASGQAHHRRHRRARRQARQRLNPQGFWGARHPSFPKDQELRIDRQC